MPTVIAAALGATPFVCAMAAEDAEGSFLDSIGISLGGGVTYEDKATVDYGASVAKPEYATTVQMSKVSLNLPGSITASYNLQRVNYITTSDERNGNKQTLLVGKKFPIGPQDFTGGLYYSAIIEDTKNSARPDQGTHSGLIESTMKQTIQPSLTYWNNGGQWGVYAQGEHIQGDTSKDVSWSTGQYKLDEGGQSWLIEPSKKYGALTVATQLYWTETKTDTDVGSLRTQEHTFTERYIEPKLTYGFEDAGVLTVSYRVSDKETLITGGAWATKGVNYFSKVRKLSVGYSQDVGPWQLEAKIRRSWETEVTNANASWAIGKQKDIVQDQIEVFATYRF
jgi:hypothetical protein